MKTKLNGHMRMYGSHMNRDLDMNSNVTSNKNVGYMNANDDYHIHRNVPMDGGNNRSHDIKRHLSMVKSRPQSPHGIHRDVYLDLTHSRLREMHNMQGGREGASERVVTIDPQFGLLRKAIENKLL